MDEVSRKIIVSFDDFGISEKANDNALLFLRAKKVERIAIMMNGILRPQDIEGLLASGAALDIHLDRKNAIDQNRKLKDTFLRRFIIFIGSYFFGENRPAAVKATWREQLDSFQRTFGRSPDGISSHEHVHFFPPYFRRIGELASTYHIPFVRFGKRSSKNYNFVAFVLNTLRLVNRHAFKKSGLLTSDYMISWDWVEQQDIHQLTASLPDGTRSEVIFHPERQEECDFLQKFLGT